MTILRKTKTFLIGMTMMTEPDESEDEEEGTGFGNLGAGVSEDEWDGLERDDDDD